MQGGELPLACLRSSSDVYELHQVRTKVGRGKNNDIVLTSSMSISSKHAVISVGPDPSNRELEHADAVLRDLNSMNGTFVNNVRVHNCSYGLQSGDIVRFGCDVNTYRFELARDMLEYNDEFSSPPSPPQPSESYSKNSMGHSDRNSNTVVAAG